MSLILWSPDSRKEINTLLRGIDKDSVGKIHHHSDTSEIPSCGPGDLVLGMGTEVLKTLVSHNLVKKNRTIGSLRFPNVVKLPGGTDLLMTYTAMVGQRDYELWVQTKLDLNLAIRKITTGTYQPSLGKYRWVTDFSDAIKFIQSRSERTGKPVPVALDTETIGLDPYKEGVWILTFQVAAKPGMSDVVYIPSREAEEDLATQSNLLEDLKFLLTSPMVSLRGANLKYDLNWIWVHYGIRCTNFTMDTMVVGSLIDENRGNSLNLHAKWYLPDLGGYDDHLNQKYDKGRMDLIPKDELLPYAAGDSDACLRVSEHMKEEILQDKRLSRFYVKVLHPALRAYEQVEQTGLLVDVPYYLELEDEIKTEIKTLEKRALSLIGGRICAKYADNLNLGRPALIKEFMFGKMGLNLTPKMFTDKAGEPSTSGDHLLMFTHDPKAKEFIEFYNQWSAAKKALSTYVAKRDSDGNIVGGFLSHLRSDSRFHATYFLFNGDSDDGGTNSGRLSARDPAIQTVPKHTKWAKKLRRAFIAPKGYVFLSNDYSQGELKIAACLANEETMIEAYRQGIDLHIATAAGIAGYEFEHVMAMKNDDPDKYDALRQLGKAGNFGLIYGMMAPGFQNYAWFSYGVKLSIEEATQARETFFHTYPQLLKWHDEYKKLARAERQISSPLGRVRHLPLIASRDREAASKAERQSVNAPVQSTLSDMSLWSTAIIHQNGWFDESPVVAMIHDQLLSYVPEENWEYYARRNRDVMQNLPFHELGWNPQLQFTVDCEIGPNLGEMKKQKLAA